MITLIVLFESLTNGYRAEILEVLSLFSIFCGILVIISKNPVLLWDKLSNSGNALKLMVPSHSRNWIGGWTNHSCMVISHKMIEIKMGYRGSKSAMFKSIVASLFSTLSRLLIFLLLLYQECTFVWYFFSNYYCGQLVIFLSYSVQNKSVAVRLFNITKFSSALRSKAFGLSVINYSTDSSGVPVKVYSNADIQKLQIIEENRSRSGVYRLYFFDVFFFRIILYSI